MIWNFMRFYTPENFFQICHVLLHYIIQCLIISFLSHLKF